MEGVQLEEERKRGRKSSVAGEQTVKRRRSTKKAGKPAANTKEAWGII